jgi:dTMP kinase
MAHRFKRRHHVSVQATGGLLPDLTLVFDLAPEAGFRRIGHRRLDHFEKEALAFHRRVRRGYREIHRTDPKRVRLIRADRSQDAVTRDVIAIVEERLGGA